MTTDPFCACRPGLVCLRCKPAPPRIWPREEPLEDGRCGACGSAVVWCLRPGWRCVNPECGAIALERRSR
jgi:hypothetical protein